MIGIFTGGESGQSREYSYHGATRWSQAIQVWDGVGDLDRPGVFAFGDGSRWEVRITALATTRKDGRGRPLHNTIVMQSEPHGDDAQLALSLVAEFLEDPEGLACRIDFILTPGLVESWFSDAQAPVPPLGAAREARVVTPRPVRQYIGLERDTDAIDRVVGAIAAVIDSKTGLVIAGELYDDGASLIASVTTRLPAGIVGSPTLLIARLDGSDGAQEIPPVSGKKLLGEGPPRSRKWLAVLAVLGLAVLVLVVVRNVIGRN